MFLELSFIARKLTTGLSFSSIFCHQVSPFLIIINCQFPNRLIRIIEVNDRLSIIIDDRPNTTRPLHPADAICLFGMYNLESSNLNLNQIILFPIYLLTNPCFIKAKENVDIQHYVNVCVQRNMRMFAI